MACKRISGRNMYIWQFRQVVKGPSAIENFLQQATDAKLDGVWIKIAVGASLYRKGLGTDLGRFNEAVAGLHERGLAVWGWHEPRCPDVETALTEAENVSEYVDELKLDGLLMDAEHKSGSSFFQGGEDEAYAYAKTLHLFLNKADKGLAISSHDQPSKHADFPFAAFAANADCNAPQYTGDIRAGFAAAVWMLAKAAAHRRAHNTALRLRLIRVELPGGKRDG